MSESTPSSGPDPTPPNPTLPIPLHPAVPPPPPPPAPWGAPATPATPPAPPPPAVAAGPARTFTGFPADGDFLVDFRRPATITQYPDGSAAIWQDNALVASFGAADVYSLAYEWRQSMVRRLPTWAAILGVLGLLFFLIGVLFFFVRENVPVQVQVLTLRLRDGRHMSIRQ